MNARKTIPPRLAQPNFLRIPSLALSRQWILTQASEAVKSAKGSIMKAISFIASLILPVSITTAANAVYVKMDVDTPAVLSNGVAFTAPKGDFFPFLGYDADQKLMKLKDGSLSFWTWTANGELVPDAEAAAAATKYGAGISKNQVPIVPDPYVIATPPVGLPLANHQIPMSLAASAEAIAHQLQVPLETAIREQIKAALSNTETVPSGFTFPVDASSGDWQNSGVKLTAGQHVVVEAAPGDKWNIGWGDVDAAGYGAPHDPLAEAPVVHTGRANSDWHWGALECAVGNFRSDIQDPQRQVEIGLKRGFTVDTGGYLYFICNDQKVTNSGEDGYGDNSGIIHVKISVSDAAPNTIKAEDRPAVAKPTLNSSPVKMPEAADGGSASR